MANMHMKERPGFTGKLNDAIRRRVRLISQKLELPSIESKFSHLNFTDGSWRGPLPGDDVNLALFIDHTLLKPESTEASILQLCKEARQHKFYAVCVNGSRVQYCVEALRGSGVRTAAVCGFPLGAGSAAAEAADLVRNGAHEVDMVMNVGALQDGNYRVVYDDIRAVVGACGPHVTTKVILETCLLTREQIIDSCILSVAAGASYVKTSTGFGKGGATPESIDIMLATVGNAAKVKASGGVRDRAMALEFVKAGVSRIGTSNGIAIISGVKSSSNY